MLRIALAACALLLFLLAAPAHAARITSDGGDGQRVFFLGLQGERNDVRLERTAGGILIRDVVPVTAEEDCRQLDANTAACPSPSEYVTVWPGEGDDRVEARDVRVWVAGGDGDDRLAGGAAGDVLQGEGGDDELDGGDGNDDLAGGPGADGLRGGPGDDALSDRGPADAFGVPSDDVLDGGDGDDFTSYAFERGPARIDLVAGAATAAGQRDRLISIEGASGSDDADVLVGDEGPNWLLGLQGRDTISAGSGDDKLEGGGGRDELFGGDGADELAGDDGTDALDGGAGDDHFGAETRAPDAYACGEGSDDILAPWSAGYGDRFAADCEETLTGAGDVLLTVGLRAKRLGPRRIGARVTCRSRRACRFELTVRRKRGPDRTPLARARVRRLAPGRSTTVPFRLDRALRGPGTVRLALGIRASAGNRTIAPLRLQPARRARITRTASSLSSISR